MKKQNIIFILTGILLSACWVYFFFIEGTDPVPEATYRPEPPSAGQQTTLPEAADRVETAYHKNAVEAVVDHPKDVEEIKKQIYDLEIEYVEDIPRLDEVVQTGDAPTRDFWLGEWASVDDSKEEVNGFNLEPQKDGTFIFYPDESTARTYTFFETPRTYTYDPVKKEFYWEMDYYGKTISHRARFINDNVLAMMLISGRKVTLDIYQKQPEQPGGRE